MKTRQYNNGDTCSVSANPGSHYTFDGWFENDSIVSSDNPYSFTVSGNRTLEGKFTANSYTITTNVSPVSAGSISGGGTYDYGDTCTLTATPNQDYEFATWTDGDGNFLSNDNPFSFTVSGDLTVRAMFSTGYNTCTITVISPHGTISGDGIYAIGDTVNLSCTPDIGYAFDGWYMNGSLVSSDNPWTFTAEGDWTIESRYGEAQSLKITTSDNNNSVILKNSSNQTYTWNLSSGLNKYYGDEPGFAFNEITGLKRGSGIYITSIDASELTSWTTIESQAFSPIYYLTSIQLPDSITSIGQQAFNSCTSLTSITLPDSTTTIGDYAFHACDILTSLNIPENVSSIGTRIIGLTSVGSITVSPNNATFDSRDNCNAIINTSTNTLVCGCKNTIIPNTVVAIGNYAFYRCRNLNSIVIPNTVVSIGDYVFEECNDLTSITLPNSTTTIGNHAFEDCRSLVSITLPNTITSIGERTFSNCRSLTSITLPDTLTSIGISAFEDCRSLVSITLPDTLTSIGISAFDNCFSLASITLPNTITSIGNFAFSSCSSLTSITLPNSLTSIGIGAFGGCYILTSITCLATTPPTLGANAFDGTNNCPIYVPWSADHSVYNSYVSSWSQYASRIVEMDGPGSLKITTNGSCSVILTNSNSQTYTWNLSNGLNEYYGDVSGFALNEITGIKAGTNQYQIYTIDAFYLTSLITLSQAAFLGCTSLTSITLPNSLVEIQNQVFDSCNNLTSITLPNSITFIGAAAFSNSDLTSINIPENVSNIGTNPFQTCPSLTSITVDSNNQYYNDGNGSNCIIETSNNKLRTGCKNTVIPNTVEIIGGAAFYSCNTLTSITLPNSLSEIQGYAFKNCTGLTSITCLATTPPILNGNDVFYNTNNCPIYVPASSVNNYKSEWSGYASRIYAL